MSECAAATATEVPSQFEPRSTNRICHRFSAGKHKTGYASGVGGGGAHRVS